tara:strand:+ start:5623 stop:6612 length:990 start_codon:yes stop_codon:yes gene_type:complete
MQFNHLALIACTIQIITNALIPQASADVIGLDFSATLKSAQLYDSYLPNDPSNLAYTNGFITYDYLGDGVNQDGSYVLRQRTDMSANVANNINGNISYEFDPAAPVQTTVIGTPPNFIMNRVESPQSINSYFNSSTSILGNSFDFNMDQFEKIIATSTEYPVADARRSFVGFSTGLLLKDITLEIPTIERQVNWIHECCNDPSALEIIDISNSLHTFGLNSIGFIFEFQDVLFDDLTAIDLTDPDTLTLLTNARMSLNFRDLEQHSFSSYSSGNPGGFSIDYDLKINKKNGSILLPEPGILGLMGLSLFFIAFYKRRSLILIPPNPAVF